MDEIVPDMNTVGAAAAAGVLVQIGNWLARWRKVRAEAGKIDAETEQTIGDGWRAFARRMEERAAQLETRISHLEISLRARDAIIVALAYKRPLTSELRALLLEIAPAAKPGHDVDGLP